METALIIMAIGLVLQSIIITTHCLDIIDKTIGKITRKIK